MLLYSILRAAHCRSTHHKLALDALSHFRGEQAEAWRNVLLRHHAAYFAGAKAPDDEFKDFRNHVLHPKDKYWGGAPCAVKRWYAAVLDALHRNDWEDFAYSAGVLSHYYTDPWHPFHTGQSQAESNIHRAHEWSINKSYDAIYRLIGVSHGFPEMTLPTGCDWLEQLVRNAAERAHAHYDKLLKHYDLEAGSRNPPEGLDAVSRDILARLIAQAVVGLARLLERAIEESGVSPPEMLLTPTTLLAAIEVPIQFIYKRIEDAEERAAVEAAYEEWQKTGKVEEHLRDDDRAVRDLHLVEVRQRNAAKRSLRIPPPLPESYPLLSRGRAGSGAASPPNSGSRNVGEAAADQAANAPQPTEKTRPKPRPEPVGESPPPAPAREDRREPAATRSPVPQANPPQERKASSGGWLGRLRRRAVTEPESARGGAESPAAKGTGVERPVAAHAGGERPLVKQPAAPQPAAPQSAAAKPVEEPRRGEAVSRRFYLEIDSPVVDAPSIGPKTAKRLQRLGVRAVRDLLALDPSQAAGRLGARHITAQTLADWQDQARLVMRIPGLRGHDAQFLVACNFRTPEQVARAVPAKLLSLVLRFLETSEGERILRSSAPPDLAEVSHWVAAAGEARRLAA